MEKILIIDDTMLILQTLEYMLSDEYEIMTLSDGTKAVETVRKFMPTIILLDVLMPDISGFDIIIQLKNDSELCNIPVIFLTGLTGEEEEEKGLLLGAADYIFKPFKRVVVKARIKNQIELLRSVEQLRLEREYSKILSGVSDDVFWVDYDIKRKEAFFSQNFSDFYHVPRVIKANAQAYIENVLVHRDSMDELEKLIYAVESGDDKYVSELHFCRYDGGNFWNRIEFKLIMGIDGKPTKAIARINDITKQRERMEELNKRAMTDQLTKLFNKEETRLRIQKCLDVREKDEKFAMLMVDIDDFKKVNDNLGHQFGDTVLYETARKIRSLFRETDILGRIGGDEFLIFIRGVVDEDDIIKKANDLSDVFRHTYSGPNIQYKVSGSIGIVFVPEHGETFEKLYRLADIALYESKHSGKDCCTVYHETMTAGTMENTALQAEAERFSASFFSDDLIYNIFEMLYETKDIDITFNIILGVIGKKFNLDRCYAIEKSLDGKSFTSFYEWCSDGVFSAKDKLLEFNLYDYGDFFEHFNSDGIFYCNDISTLNKNAEEEFAREEVKSFLLSEIREAGELNGYIGFDDCHTQRVWRGEEIATISYISKILSTFIFKRHISKELFDSYVTNTAILDNLNGYVLVIDPNTYDTLYINNAYKMAGAEVGGKCYEISQFSDKPCEHCPMSELTPQHPYANVDVFSKLTGEWVDAAASEFTWLDGRRVVLMCCTDITRYKNGEARIINETEPVQG